MTASTDRRGAEVFAHQLGNRLGAGGHEVHTVAVAVGRGGDRLPFPVLGPGPRAPRTVAALTRAAAGAGVVVVHGSSGLWPTLVACTVARRPFVYRSIGDPAFWGRRRWARTRTGWALRRAARVVALSEGLRDALVAQYRLDPARVVVSPNAVDVDRFPAANDADRLAARRRLGLDPASPLLGYLGALSPEKRPEWAVRAVAGLPGARLVMAGAGPSEEAVRGLAGRVAPGRVALLAPLEDPWPLLAAVDVLLVPSRTEGMPGVVIEAGLVGRPVVATAVGAVPEMIGVVAGGAAVDPDDLDGFVAAVARVLDGGGAPGPDRAAVAAAHGIGAVAPAWSALLDAVGAPDLRGR